jgi:pimeloyl-ACP methyl ester carboxylesterase/DNA-binding CsgD family transcriptional regulator
MALWWRFGAGWMEGLATRFRVVQHDMRGHGMSERGLPADYNVRDVRNVIDAVLDRLQLDRFVIYGLSGMGHLGVQYAVDHPERVEALILNGTTISSPVPSFMRAVAAENWEFFLRGFIPASVGPEESQRWFETVRDSTTPEDWQVVAKVGAESTTTEPLGRVRVPTLLLHARGLARTPPEGAPRLAAMIPNSRLVLISGDHPLGDAAEGLAAIDQFLAEAAPERQPETARSSDGLSAREIEVLRLVATGRSNQQVADELVISLNTVRRHISNLFAKIDVANRVEASAYARDHGIV